MTFTIPVWAFWVLGGIAGIAVLALASVGVLVLMCADKIPGGRIFTK